MAEMVTSKYLRTQVLGTPHHVGIQGPPVKLITDKDFGDQNINLKWEYILHPGEMVMKHHNHPFDQYLTFLGPDPNNMLELNGEIELVLSEDGIHKETHIIRQATSIFIPKGLYHCPLIFRRVDKPFLFIELFYAGKYSHVDGEKRY
jgi:oxalate decarboxylase/phosphoglucose isomerase-like protein (cupin superfamily)